MWSVRIANSHAISNGEVKMYGKKKKAALTKSTDCVVSVQYVSFGIIKLIEAYKI